MFWLIDSRNRMQTGKRLVWAFEQNQQGLIDLWERTLEAEGVDKEDHDGYMCHAKLDPDDVDYANESEMWDEKVETYNEFWNEYGLLLCIPESLVEGEDLRPWHDMVMMRPDQELAVRPQ